MIPSSLHLIESDIFTYCYDLQIIEFEEGSKLPSFNQIIIHSNAIIMIPQNSEQSFYFDYENK